MTEAKAPERIWAWPDGFSGWYSAGASTEVNLGLMGHAADHQTTFVRSDLHDALVKAADELEKFAEKWASFSKATFAPVDDTAGLQEMDEGELLSLTVLQFQDFTEAARAALTAYKQARGETQ